MHLTPDHLWPPGRRDFFKAAGLSGLPALTAMLAGCGQPRHAQESASSKQASGRRAKRKLVWIPQAAGDWDLPLRVAHQEFCNVVGWEYQNLGNPVYSVQNHLDELNNAISARPDAIVTELESPGIVSGFRKAMDVGIAMVIADQVIPEEAAKLGLNAITQDAVATGRKNGWQAAEWAQKITGKNDGVIVIGNGNPGSFSIDLRQKGTEEGVVAFNRERGTNYISEAFADSGFDDVVLSMSKYGAQLDQKGDRVVALVGLGGGSAVAIWKTLKDRDVPAGKKIAAGSFDAFPDQQNAIAAGYLQWGIEYNLLAIGYLSAASAWMQVESGERYWDMHSQGEVVLHADLPRIRARTEAWMAKAREFGLVQS